MTKPLNHAELEFAEALQEAFPDSLFMQITGVSHTPEGVMIQRRLATPCLISPEGLAYADRNDNYMHLISVIQPGDEFEAELSKHAPALMKLLRERKNPAPTRDPS